MCLQVHACFGCVWCHTYSADFFGTRSISDGPKNTVVVAHPNPSSDTENELCIDL